MDIRSEGICPAMDGISAKVWWAVGPTFAIEGRDKNGTDDVNHLL